MAIIKRQLKLEMIERAGRWEREREGGRKTETKAK